MAKIHNPQNQEGINLVNEKIFNEQVASLNDAIAKEVAAAKPLLQLKLKPVKLLLPPRQRPVQMPMPKK